MEERVPTTSHDNHHNHQTSMHEAGQEDEFDDYYVIDNVNRTKNNNDDQMPIIVPPHDTYVILVPKDQIYRVPPPENAEIVEKYRNPVQINRSGRRLCAYWSLSIVLVVAFIISVFICIHHFTLKPKNPTFYIKHFAIKSRVHNKKNHSLGFQVSMETSNPNSVNDIGYVEGIAILMYKGKKIGHGSFPRLGNQESGKTNTMEVKIATLSSKGGLPKELQPQSSNNKKSKPLNFNLLLNIPLKLKTWLYTKKVDVKVSCDFEVNSIGDNIKILSQKCDVQRKL
ncbi:unnamed protein product [Amaranthus hypochondriacus]